ncbi:MAG TPA: Type 1 glutamine amidotransferase-like domain-containing protein [Candidatus Saccharimonadales bacterium]|nr:Type 1 glutamine amidotransferase-like domain-containing protein [Candidatus Saccharimonadales bacterium]
MTRYILHGGNIRGSGDEGKAYFEEVFKDLGKSIKVLFCFFAQPRELWQPKYREWSERISRVLGDLDFEFTLAEPQKFREQINDAEVLYIYGGDDELLLETVQKTDEFVDSLSNFKVVTGSSAGAILLADHSWGCDRRKVAEGLGVVPTNTLVHYGSSYGSDDARGPIDWDKAEQELREAVGPNAEIIKLHEGEFEVYEH